MEAESEQVSGQHLGTPGASAGTAPDQLSPSRSCLLQGLVLETRARVFGRGPSVPQAGGEATEDAMGTCLDAFLCLQSGVLGTLDLGP